MTENYCLNLFKQGKSLSLKITANDSCHAQAQAIDIQRSLNAQAYNLIYDEVKNNTISDLFKELAFNEFKHNVCCEWSGTFCNGVPCTYVFGKRIFLKPLILRYLDIPSGFCVKLKCENKKCINPYHFMYMDGKNSKLSGGDTKLLLAYRSQGIRVTQIAEALNVHRSTVHRKLKNEHFFARATSHG